MTEQATVFVVDDDEAARESLRWLLESVGHRVRCHASAREFLAAWDRAAPGCLVLDVRMPGMSGMELQEHLKTEEGCLPVIIVTGHGDIPMAVRAMRGGAVDFLQKPYNDQIMLDRIQQALDLCRQRRREHLRQARIQAAYQHLTPREAEVAARVVLGKANKVIAIEMGLSHKTVEAHRANVMEKMRAGSLSELVRMFVRLGLVSDEESLGEAAHGVWPDDRYGRKYGTRTG